MEVIPRPNPEEVAEDDSQLRPIMLRLDHEDLAKLEYLKELGGKKSNYNKAIRHCIRYAFEIEQANAQRSPRTKTRRAPSVL